MPYRSGSAGVKAPSRLAFWISAVVFALLYIALYAGLRHLLHFDFTSEAGLIDFRNRLRAHGPAMPLFYGLIYAARAVVYIPEPVLMVSAGFLLGTVKGVFLVAAGSLLASSIAFGIGRLARRFGGAWILERWLRRRFPLVTQHIDDFSFRTILILRMMPVFPFMFVVYGAALMDVSFGPFALAMGLGVIAPAIFYAMLGDAVVHGGMGGIANSWPYFVTGVLGLIVLMVVCGRALKPERSLPQDR